MEVLTCKGESWGGGGEVRLATASACMVPWDCEKEAGIRGELIVW